MNNTYCIFSALYFPHVGGVENYTFNLARELNALGNKVIIVTNNTEDAASHQVCDFAEIYRLPCSDFMGGRFPLTKHDARFNELWQTICAKPVTQVIVNTRFYPLSLLGVQFAAKRKIIPLVIDHGSAHLTVGKPAIDLGVQRVEHIMTNRLKKYPARYFGVSQKSVNWLRHFGIEGEGVLNNSIDAAAFRSKSSKRAFRTELNLAQDDFTVAFTGRLAPEKGIQHLAAAAEMLADRNIHVLVAGDGVLSEELAAKASCNLHLLGPLNGEDVAALLMECDAFCMPTRSEGFSTSLLEAAACGLAPITTDVGGVDELVPSPDFGLILKDAQPQTVAQAILELAKDRKRCKQIGENARARVEQEFNWKRTAQKVEAACTQSA